MRRRILASGLASAFMFFGAVTSKAAEVTTRLRADVSEQGTLTVETGYLTNYVARGVNPETGEEGPIKFLKRNKQAITLPTDIQWNGVIPSVSISWPEFNTRTTQIDLATYPYPGNIGYQNSDIVFRGANLLSLATDLPETRTERIDAITLFLLNTLSLAEISGEIAGGTDEFFDTNLTEKIAPLAEFIADFQSTLQQVEDVYALTQLLLEQQRAMLSAAGIEPASTYEINAAYGPLESFLTSLDDIGITVTVSPEVRAARTGTLKDQYRKLIESVEPLSDEEVLQTAVNEFANRYGAATSEDERTALLFQFVINPAGDVFEILERDQYRQLQDLKNSNAPQAEIDRLESRIRTTRRAFAVTQVARLLFSDVDIVQLARDEPEEIVGALFAIGYTLRGELITVDNIEIVTKRTRQLWLKEDGRGSAFNTIRAASDNASAWMKALQLGGDIGNKAIPFIWDLVLGPNYLRTSIVDGTVDPYGRAETLISVDRIEADASTTEFEFLNADPSVRNTILADAGDTINISAFLSRPQLFAEDRAPWKVNSSQIPSTLYSVGVVTPDRYFERALCVRKIYGNTDFAVQTIAQATFLSSLAECGEGTTLGTGFYCTVPGARTAYSDPTTLPASLTIQQPVLEATSPIQSQRYIVSGEADEQFSVIYRNYGLPAVTYVFDIEPASDVATIAINTDRLTRESLEITAQLTNLPEGRVLSQIVWNWGDGTSSIVTSSEPVTHTYTDRGQYTVTASARFENGSRLTGSAEVAATTGPPTQPPGTPLAIPGDGNVRLNWNGVEDAVSYSVYSSTESFGNPPDFTNYALLENGRVQSGIEGISHTVFGLENDVRHYFVVVATLANNDEVVVVAVSISPAAPIGGDKPYELVNYVELSFAEFEGYTYRTSGQLSPDGRYVLLNAFVDILPTDRNRSQDIYLLDRIGRRLTHISRPNDQNDTRSGFNRDASMSDDGGTILYSSLGTGWQEGENGERCFFVRNVSLERNSSLDLPCDPSGTSNTSLRLSSSGDNVLLQTIDALVPGDTNESIDVYLYDIATREVSLISSVDGENSVEGASLQARMSSNERFIVYSSTSRDLVRNDLNGERDVFRYDRATKTTALISKRADGVLGNGLSESPDVDDDGNVVFSSSATNLVEGDTNNRVDVFRYLAEDDSVLRMVTNEGEQPNELTSQPLFSDDGKFIAFRSVATNFANLSSFIGNGYLYSVADETVELVGRTDDGRELTGGTSRGQVSNGGKFVLFGTGAENFEDDFGNLQRDSDLLLIRNRDNPLQ